MKKWPDPEMQKVMALNMTSLSQMTSDRIYLWIDWSAEGKFSKRTMGLFIEAVESWKISCFEVVIFS